MRTKGLSKRTPARTKFIKNKAEKLSRFGLLPAFMRVLPRILSNLDKKYPGLLLISNCDLLRTQIKELRFYSDMHVSGRYKGDFCELVYWHGCLAVLTNFETVEWVTVSKDEYARLSKRFLLVEGLTCYLKLGKEDYKETYLVNLEII